MASARALQVFVAFSRGVVEEMGGGGDYESVPDVIGACYSRPVHEECTHGVVRPMSESVVKQRSQLPADDKTVTRSMRLADYDSYLLDSVFCVDERTIL